MSPEDYRRAQALDLVASGGETRLPPSRQQWLNPVGLRAVEDGLEWLPRESRERGGVITPTEGLLEDVLRLAEADSAAVVDFASRHGVLGVFPNRSGDVRVTPQTWYRPGEYVKESLDVWHAAATRARALLAAAAKLRQGRPLTDDERVPVLHAAWPDTEPDYTAHEVWVDGQRHVEGPADDEAALRQALLNYRNGTLGDDRAQLSWAVTTWMQEAGAGLVLAWSTGAAAPELTIGGDLAWGCLAAVTVQVALACARAEPVQTCDGCGTLHAPQRKPKPGQRSFCQACRDAGVPVKLANRDRRAKLRAAREGDQQ